MAPEESTIRWSLAPIVVSPFIGSFLGTVIARLPAGRSIVRGRSQCDSCGTALAWFDLIPIASWLRYRGRCRHCGARIGGFYPAVEMAALAVAVAATLTDGHGALSVALDCVQGWMLLAAAWIDVDHCVLPDALTLPLVLLGLAAVATQEPAALMGHALAAALGYASFRGIALLYRLWRGRDGLGEGDAKMLAAAGAWLGLSALSWLVLIAALCGLLAAAVARLAGRPVTRTTALPFGAFMAVAYYGLRLYQMSL